VHQIVFGRKPTRSRPAYCTDDIKFLSAGGSFRPDPPGPTTDFILDNRHNQE
jgi:hypothetical protein